MRRHLAAIRAGLQLRRGELRPGLRPAAFSLLAGQTITNGRNATYSPTSGRVTATNVSHNASLAPGASVSFGFQATHIGTSGPPTGYALNGSTCTSG